MGSAHKTKLNYASAASPGWGSQRRRLVAVVLLVLMVIIGMWYGRTLERVQWVLVTHACRAYQPPADQIVQEEGASDQVQIPASNQRISVLRNDDGVSWSRTPPRCLISLHAVLVGLQPPLERVPLFVGELRDPAGKEYIVAVEWKHRPRFAGGFASPVTVVGVPTGRLGELPAKPLIWSARAANARAYVLSDDGLFRIYAGERDPLDPTHLTIRYEVGGGAGVLDGWLRSRGQAPEMIMRFRCGPGAKEDLSGQPAPPLVLSGYGTRTQLVIEREPD